MSDIRITVAPGTKHRLLTGSKYCQNDILIEALNAKLTDLTVKQNGTYNPADYNSSDGFSSVNVDVYTRPKPDGTLTINREISGPTSIVEPVTKEGGETAYKEVAINLTLAEGLIVPSGPIYITEYKNNINVAPYATAHVTIPKYSGEIENIITFKVQTPNYAYPHEYEAREGMTWYDWINDDTYSKQDINFICSGNEDNPVYMSFEDIEVGQELEVQGDTGTVYGWDIIDPKVTYYYL